MNIVLERQQKRSQIVDKKNIEHIKTVLKKKVGDTLKVGYLNGDIFLVKILDDALNFEILETVKAKVPHIRLINALARPQTMKKIIEHGTTMGVFEFIFFHAHLSEKSYESSKVLEPESYNELMKLGLSQSGIYTTMPKLSINKNIETLPLFHGHNFLLSLRESNKFSSPISANEVINLVIGPERGFIPMEEEFFLSKGFKPVKISESILRVEHAVFASIAQLDLLRMT